MQDWPERERYTAEDLLQIIRILRDRENGCPWDKVQTHASIRKNFLEETCEVLEAIDAECSRRAGSVSRNTWITEAVTERLARLASSSRSQSAGGANG